MSNSVIPNLPVVKYMPEEMNVLRSDDAAFSILAPASEFRSVQYTTNSTSLSSDNFKLPVSSPSDMISRVIYISKTYAIDFVGTRVGGGNLLSDWGLYTSLRANPLHRSIVNLSVKINDNSIAIPCNDIITAVNQHYHYNEGKNLLANTMSPNYKDASADYNALVNTIRNPLGSFSDSNSYTERRGSHPIQISNHTVTTATVQFTLTEPLYISPLSTSALHSDSPLTNITSLELNVIYDSNLVGCLLSHATSSASTFSNITVRQIDTPSVILTIRTLPINIPRPLHAVYDYHGISRYITDGTTIAPGASTNIVSNSVQLSSVPNYVYIYARRSNATHTYTKSDTFMALNSIELSYGNRSGILAGTPPQGLYDIAVRNGCTDTFPEWYPSGNGPRQIFGCGSVLKLKWGVDVPLSPLDSPGVQRSQNLSVKVNVTNTQPDNCTISLYIVVVESGLMMVQPSKTILQTSILSSNDSLNAPMIETHDLHGGNLWSGIKSVITKVAPYVSRALPMVKTGYDVLKTLGFGADGGEGEGCGGDSLGGRTRRIKYGKRRGKGDVLGGELVSRSQLRHML